MSGLLVQGCASMRFRISASVSFSPGTICAIGRGDPTSGWDWMRRRCCATQTLNGTVMCCAAKTTDDLKAYLLAPQPAEAAWLSPEQQHEEAWFLGLRLNQGVKPAELRSEFGGEAVSRGSVRRGAARGCRTVDVRRKDGAAHCAGTAAVERSLSGVSRSSGEACRVRSQSVGVVRAFRPLWQRCNEAFESAIQPGRKRLSPGK